MTEKDGRIEQVERILTLMGHATYPGKGMWRFETVCMMIARGATAEAETGEHDVSSCTWFAAALKILKMEPKNGLYEWTSFTPKEMTQIAKAFLPAARALILWVDKLRQLDAEEQECDWKEIGFTGGPEMVILTKLGGYDKGPTLAMIKSLLFTEDRFCNTVYSKLLFEQMEEDMETDGEYLDYVEPTDEGDRVECETIIEALREDRAEREHREEDKLPGLDAKDFQWFVENLSASNEEYLARVKTEDERICREFDEKFPAFGQSAVDANKLAKLYASINVSTLKIEQRLDRLLTGIRGNGNVDMVAGAVRAAVRDTLLDEFVTLTDAIVDYGDFKNAPAYDLTGISTKLAEVIRIRYSSDALAKESCLEKLEDVSFSLDCQCGVIRASLIEGLTEDCHRLFEWLTNDEDGVPDLEVTMEPQPAPQEQILPRAVAAEANEAEKTHRIECYHRFKVEWFTSGLKVTDMENFPNEPYFITPANGNAAKAALILIRDYDAGNEQTHKSSRRWIGAFQSGRGDATRFRDDQIFKLPKWSAEKGHFLPNQFDGRWRLWTDAEMQLTEEERLANFKAAHPHGYGQ